jgi:hypothetical protein
VHCRSICGLTAANPTAKLGDVEAGEPFPNQLLYEPPNILARFLWYPVGKGADFLEEGMLGVSPVKELP